MRNKSVIETEMAECRVKLDMLAHELTTISNIESGDIFTNGGGMKVILIQTNYDSFMFGGLGSKIFNLFSDKPRTKTVMRQYLRDSGYRFVKNLNISFNS
jgi:hypothetical protein